MSKKQVLAGVITAGVGVAALLAVPASVARHHHESGHRHGAFSGDGVEANPRLGIENNELGAGSRLPRLRGVLCVSRTQTRPTASPTTDTTPPTVVR